MTLSPTVIVTLSITSAACVPALVNFAPTPELALVLYVNPVALVKLSISVPL